MQTLPVPVMPEPETESPPVFHVSVLPEETLDALFIRPGDTVVDATVGGAGHFMRIAERLGQGGTLIGIDADADALERARERLRGMDASLRPSVHLVEDNFRNLGRILDRVGVRAVDRALFDLGWSGFQLAGGKGFSFQTDEPLLMTYGRPDAGNTAADIVNSMPEAELANLIYEYGEERNSRAIARAIAAARRSKRILTTGQLADIIARAGARGGRTNPATKTFQALRIAVNDEFGALREGLAAAYERLAPGGRLAVISFHSSEDRIVKQFMKEKTAAGAVAVTRKPVAPGRAELLANRRARSAKLRVIEKQAS
jgi:16S rRNA (cytosine1402-N4)-methyltransferase